MKGLCYCGQWQQNRRHGYGRMVYPDGSRYLGNWANNAKDGQGRYTYADGSSYDGMWVANQKHGHGVYRFTDGSSYVGTFYNNDFVSGEWQLANGTSRYVGNFEKDVPVGSGVFIHRCGEKAGAYLEEGTFQSGKWQPGAIKGSTKFVPHLELRAPRMKAQRVPLGFSADCNGHTTTDLVRAANYAPLRRWIDALTPTAEDPRRGVELKGIEVCALSYDGDGERLVELRVRPIVVDAEGKRLRGRGEETVLLKEPAARLFTLLESAAGSAAEPLVVLERALQFVSPDAEHLQHRLPVVEVTADGAVGGPFVRAVDGALSLSLWRAENTIDLVPPLRSNPAYTSARERVLLYAQHLHRDAIATITEKLQIASVDPAVCAYVAVPLSQVVDVSTDAITVIAAAAVLQRRAAQKLPQSTAPALRPPTPLVPPPLPRPDLQPLYDAKKVRDQEKEAE
ncbi:hypothetical protein STCU_04818 [Strigomonas culicis]|nr:hypothetical protein STCU_04818 [Strigomonas culicis]|eukprot:EPY28914.1 hypothetical protein STCU_04818 [Strigomonas culicis]